MKTTPQPFDAMRAAALDKAMHYHATFNRPAGSVQTPYGGDHPKATSEEVIATAQKFLGFLLVDKKTVQARAT